MKTQATVMIVTMKNFLIGEPRKYRDIAGSEIMTTDSWKLYQCDEDAEIVT